MANAVELIAGLLLISLGFVMFIILLPAMVNVTTVGGAVWNSSSTSVQPAVTAINFMVLLFPFFFFFGGFILIYASLK